jgi:hypothetical protein
MTTSNSDLERVCKILKISPFFNGVYLEDELPAPKPGFYIVNFEKISQASSVGHWVLAAFGKGDIYCDSFGCAPPILIDQFMKKRGKFAYNAKTIQDLSSNLCGWYCIACAFYIYRVNNRGQQLHDRLNDWADLFGTDTRVNGNILKQFLMGCFESPSIRISDKNKKWLNSKLFSKK